MRKDASLVPSRQGDWSDDKPVDINSLNTVTFTTRKLKEIPSPPAFQLLFTFFLLFLFSQLQRSIIYHFISAADRITWVGVIQEYFTVIVEKRLFHSEHQQRRKLWKVAFSSSAVPGPAPPLWIIRLVFRVSATTAGASSVALTSGTRRRSWFPCKDVVASNRRRFWRRSSLWRTSWVLRRHWRGGG